jgi:hypothetical protein
MALRRRKSLNFVRVAPAPERQSMSIGAAPHFFFPQVALLRYAPQADFAAVQAKMRHRGLRWLLRHGHLDDDAIHVLDRMEHAGGWSVDAAVTIPGWDRQGLERLARYCALPAATCARRVSHAAWPTPGGTS